MANIHRNKTFCAILVEVIMGNIYVNFWISGSGEDVFYPHFFYSSGGHFVQWSKAICSILVEGIVRNSQFGPVVQEILFRDFFYFQLWYHFVQRSLIICANLVEGIMENIHVKRLL